MLNQFTFQFSFEAEACLYDTLVGPDATRVSASHAGQLLQLRCTFQQLLAFEADLLRHARVEWYKTTVKRKEAWHAQVAIRATVDQLNNDL